MEKFETDDFWMRRLGRNYVLKASDLELCKIVVSI